MQELIAEIAKSLVDNPDEVKVTIVEKENLTVYQLSVAKDDMGKVIGKKGRIAQAIRSIVKAASVTDGKKVAVDIV